MNAVRIRKGLESDTLHLPELRPMLGKDVEIIILEDSAAATASNGRPDIAKLRQLASEIDFDFDAFEHLRKISTL